MLADAMLDNVALMDLLGKKWRRSPSSGTPSPILAEKALLNTFAAMISSLSRMARMSSCVNVAPKSFPVRS